MVLLFFRVTLYHLCKRTGPLRKYGLDTVTYRMGLHGRNHVDGIVMAAYLQTPQHHACSLVPVSPLDYLSTALPGPMGDHGWVALKTGG